VNSDPQVEAVTAALAEPFEASEVRWKPATISGNRALAIAYVDARVIQDRLDDVLGVEGWQDEYECLSDGSVMCRLRIKVGGEWITKMDVGGPSEQPDGGDRMKAAFSDSLKRAAVKFGLGRYLYRLPAQWVDYDPRNRQFVKVPTLPAFALPKAKPAEPKPAPKEQPPAQPAAQPAAKKAAKAGAQSLPADGGELRRRLHDYDAKLAAQGLCERGALVKHVVAAGVEAGYGGDLSTWSGPAVQLAIDETKNFEAARRKPNRAAS
jgi:hypothetical protein